MRKAIMMLTVITIIFSGTIAAFATDMLDINQENKELDEFLEWAYKNQIDIFFPEQEEVNNLINIEIGNSIEEIKEFLLNTKEGIDLTPINEYENTKEDNRFINKDLNDLLDSDNIMSSEFEFYDNIIYTRQGFIIRTDQEIGDIEMPDLEASVRYSYYDVLDYGKVFEEVKSINTYDHNAYQSRTWDHFDGYEIFQNYKKSVRINFEGRLTYEFPIFGIPLGTTAKCYGNFTFYPGD